MPPMWSSCGWVATTSGKRYPSSGTLGRSFVPSSVCQEARKLAGRGDVDDEGAPNPVRLPRGEEEELRVSVTDVEEEVDEVRGFDRVEEGLLPFLRKQLLPKLRRDVRLRDRRAHAPFPIFTVGATAA